MIPCAPVSLCRAPPLLHAAPQARPQHLLPTNAPPLPTHADIISFNADDPGYFGFSRFKPFQGKHFEKRLRAEDRLTDDVVSLAQHALARPWSCAMLCVVDRVHNHSPNNFQARRESFFLALCSPPIVVFCSSCLSLFAL